MRMYKFTSTLALVTAVSAAQIIGLTGAQAEDWPQWRGPNRSGVATESPPLAAAWPAGGPVRAWESEPIPGGHSSVAVAGGKVYLKVNWPEPIATRTLSDRALRSLGWFPETLPEDLLKAVEAARLSADRAGLTDNEVKPWIDKWVGEHLGEPNKQVVELGALFARAAEICRGRLTQGPKALTLETLNKLSGIKDRKFPSQDELDKWFKENAIDPETVELVRKQIPTTSGKVFTDTFVCLSAADGNTLWRKEYPIKTANANASSTPCVVDGRVYVAGLRTLYCLDAATGNEVWKVETKGKDISSSVAVVDGLAVLLCGPLTAYDIADGKEVWSQAKVRGQDSSPVVWTHAGESYLLCNAGGKELWCVKAKTGDVLWTVPGGENNTPCVQGDTAVVTTARYGLLAYSLSPEKAEKLWSVPGNERCTSPVIWNGRAFMVASRVLCVRLTDGAVLWSDKTVGGIPSPLIADGKLLALVNGGRHLLMVDAGADKYSLLGKVELNAAAYPSPTFADGKLFVRLATSIACFDLTKGP